ncbi:MAG: NADH-quinone oxidoreductase subunit L [Candidatus Accumulibacter sp.]|jgi:NADH-quinone oxidoreductase subunit L|nr:NADH-quinone oxidoreductase subunit L [Accumulibacter sp.]
MGTQGLYWLVPLAPLFGALVAGVFCRVISRRIAGSACILGVAVAFAASVAIFLDVREGGGFDGIVYTWLVSDESVFGIGFLIDPLTSAMMLIVTFVSLAVHIYAIGYMRDDPGYNRFFSYIALFTFSMLMLVMSNNFLQLFFGWEAVGLVSYLLIGFWHDRPSAAEAGMKAFLVNRVGDFGFVLGIGLIFAHFGTLDYTSVFNLAEKYRDAVVPLFGSSGFPLVSVICIMLFVGAMGKSAQMPFHVWLPESMEGPTPISALIHAATMVTAGIFMVARMSPLFELSETALSFVMVVGASTALFMGFLSIVQTDIKRVIAFSTLSQLGYMTAALGASAYSAAIFHLMTHAFFKALLFLAAGSVIIGMRHEQDIRYMGGLRKYMPVTGVTALIGSLALAGVPFLSGFYSKDSIIEAVRMSEIPGSGFAGFSLLTGVFVTAFYTFRLYFLVFHGRERFFAARGKQDGMHAHGFSRGQAPEEPPWTMTAPLIVLAIPSVIAGYLFIEPMLFGGFFHKAIVTADSHPAMERVFGHFSSPLEMALKAPGSAIFWLTAAGILLAWFLYLARPAIPAAIRARGGVLLEFLENGYYFDRFYAAVFCGGARLLGKGLWKAGDSGIIDGLFVGGSVRAVCRIAGLLRSLQSGHLARYAFSMAAGICAIFSLWFFIHMNWIKP